MSLQERLVLLGRYLFRWRSYTPLVMVILFYLERRHFSSPFGSRTLNTLYELGCFFISLSGEFIRVVTIGFAPQGTSGRNIDTQRADILNTTGIYSLVRNPLYLANFIIFMGVTLLGQSWELILINTPLFTGAYVPIIFTEESFLLQKFGEPYKRYLSEVPCCLPGISLWKPNEYPWSWRMVFRREPDSLMSLVIVYFIIIHFRLYIITGTFGISRPWLFLTMFITLLWLTAKILKKYTAVLKTPRIL